MRGSSGRIIFTPFGPIFTPNSGSNAQWQKRSGAQEERIRAQREMMQRARDRALLQELERRLRTEGATSQPDIEELMQKLRSKLSSEPKVDESPKTEQQQQSEFGTVYDFFNAWMKEQNETMREERERLQKQWEKANTTQQSSKPMEDRKPMEEREEVYSPEELQKAEEEAKQAPDEAKTAPESKSSLSDGTVVYLKNEANGAELYLVGTSHISQQSVEEVRDVIQKVKPDYVMVELDRKRYNSMMRGRDNNNPFNFVQQMVQTLTNGNVGAVGKLMGLGLSGFYRLLATRGLQPGQEMRTAIEEGKKVGAKIVLGDQDIDVTMKNFGEQMSMQDALQFFTRPMPSGIAQKMNSNADPSQMFEQMRDRKIVREFNEVMERDAPAFTRVLLTERNEAMTKALRNLKGKVVGVVGLAHLDGIEQLWRDANEQHLNGN